MFATHCLSMIACIAFSAFMLVYGIPRQCPPYPGYGIAATVFPTILCAIILGGAVFNLLRVFIQKTGKGLPAKITMQQGIYFSLFILVLALGMPLMKVVGFIPGGIVMTAALAWLCGMRKPVSLAAVSVVTTLILYAAFWYGLKVMLP